MLQDDLAGLEAQVAMLMQRADITPADLQALQDQVAMLMQRADITPADLQALEDRVAMLMQRADITPADLQALEDRVAMLMQRADITPADLQALEDQVAALMQRADITPADLQALQDEVTSLMYRLGDAVAELALLRAQTQGGVEIDPRIAATDWRYLYAVDARVKTGGQDPTLSSEGHDRTVRQIQANADDISMLYYWWPAGGTIAQVDPECAGTVCAFGDPADPPITRQTLVPPPSDITFFPVMRLNGIEIHESVSSGVDDFGPWLGGTSGAVLDHVVAMDQQRWWDSGEYYAARIVWGDTTGHDPLPGVATWSGVLVGTGGKPDSQGYYVYTQVRGAVDMTVHFGGSATLDVVLSGIRGLDQGEVYNVDPWMSLPLNAGAFQDGTYLSDLQSPQRYVEGQFFGPNAEEAGGLFADAHVSDADAEISGAFVAARGDQ